jgi:hypothetical protein
MIPFPAAALAALTCLAFLLLVPGELRAAAGRRGARGGSGGRGGGRGRGGGTGDGGPSGLPAAQPWALAGDGEILDKLRRLAETDPPGKADPAVSRAFAWDTLRSVARAVAGPGDPRVWAAAARSALALAGDRDWLGAAAALAAGALEGLEGLAGTAESGVLAGTSVDAAGDRAGAAGGTAGGTAAGPADAAAQALLRETRFARKVMAALRARLDRAGLPVPPPAYCLLQLLHPAPDVPPAPAPLPGELRAVLAAAELEAGPRSREALVTRSRLGEALADNAALADMPGPSGGEGHSLAREARGLLRSASEGLDELLGREHPDALDARERLARFLSGGSGPGLPAEPLPGESPPQDELREALAIYLETAAVRAIAAARAAGALAAPVTARTGDESRTGEEPATSGNGEESRTGDEPATSGSGDTSATSGNGEESRTGDEPATSGTWEEPVAAGTWEEPVAAGTWEEPVASGTGDEPVTPGTGDVPVTPGTGDEPATSGTGDEPVTGGGPGAPPVAPSSETLELLALHGDEAAFAAAAGAARCAVALGLSEDFGPSLAVSDLEGRFPPGAVPWGQEACLKLANAAKSRLGPSSPTSLGFLSAYSEATLSELARQARMAHGTAAPRSVKEECGALADIAGTMVVGLRAALGTGSPEASRAAAILARTYALQANPRNAASLFAPLLDELEGCGPGTAPLPAGPPAVPKIAPGRRGRDRLAARVGLAGCLRGGANPRTVTALLAPCLDALGELPPEGGVWPWPPELAGRALLLAGETAFREGDRVRAEELLRRSLEALDPGLMDPAFLGTALEMLTAILADRRDPDSLREAAGLLLRAAELRKFVDGPDSPLSLLSLGRAAGSLEEAGDAEEALALHRKVLAEAARMKDPPATVLGRSRRAVARLGRPAAR